MRPCVEDLSHNLRRCIFNRNAAEALRLHTRIHEQGLDSHPFLANTLVVALAQSGNISVAHQVFRKLSSPDGSSFHALISGFAKYGQPHDALALYQRMQASSSFLPSIHTYVAVLKACARLQNLDCGCEIHSNISRRGALERDAFIGSALVDMYAKCGCLFKAQEAFNMIHEKNIISWTALISGYTDNGYAEEALHWFEKMQNEGIPPDDVTYVCSLKACASIGDAHKGKIIHANVVEKGLERDIIVGSALVMMYVKCGLLISAHKVFDKAADRDAMLWSTLILGYAEEGMADEALTCYKHMLREGICPDLVIFVCVVKACSNTGEAQEGYAIHADIVQKGMETDAVVGSTLVVMYTKCGLLTTAQKVFDILPTKDVVLWSALIAGYADKGFCREAIDWYKHMKFTGICPDVVVFICIIKACGSVGATQEGQEVHMEVTKKGLEGDAFIANTLTDMYISFNLFDECHAVFNRNFFRTIVSWNALLAGYADYGHGKEAFETFTLMQLENVAPDSFTYICSLKACGSIGATHKGSEVHAEITKRGMDKDIAIGSALVDRYMKCGWLPDAQDVFNKLTGQDAISWNTIISGYLEHGYSCETLDCIQEMEKQDVAFQISTYVCGLKACGNLRSQTKGLEMHAEIVKKGMEMDVLVGSSLVDMYVKCSLLTHAQEVFQELPTKDAVLWNILLAGFIDHQCDVEAFHYFEQLQNEGVFPDDVSFIYGLKACGILGNVPKGHEIHAELVRKGWEGNLFLSNSLVDMYLNSGTWTEAQSVFKKFPNRNVVSWNTLFVGLEAQGEGGETLKYFDMMEREGVLFDCVTAVLILRACSTEGSTDKGQRIHVDVVRMGFGTDVLVGNTLVDLYYRCGLPVDAKYTFVKLSSRTTASWNAVISGCVGSGNGEEALAYLEQMHYESISPDEVTFVCCLNVCGGEGATMKGQELHTSIFQKGFESDTVIGNTLIDMYAKCGLLDEAEHVFDSLSDKTVYSWNLILAAYSQAGESEKVFWILDKMLEEGVNPNFITFYSVLNACNHTGSIDKCHMYFAVMSKDYGIIPTLPHFNGLLHVLRRADHVDESVAVINKMPYHPALEVWHAVLGTCRRWRDVELGRQAFEQAVQLDEKNPTAYIAMFNIYADIDLQEDGNGV